VNYPVWDFIQPENFMFLELQPEIGLVNNVLDKLYSFIDDQVEAVTLEEATARNTYNVCRCCFDKGYSESKWMERKWGGRIGISLIQTVPTTVRTRCSDCRYGTAKEESWSGADFKEEEFCHCKVTENILLEYAAAYHGGKINGVDCR
jgi:hypothetical protein